ncbi:sensor histidine kinase [Paenibacillus turicensis]|uniref:cache domain-containing sensor histidine kinase n=1 Tax=Paenibacillus turicensis TaxID=160487 RepID=UPI003D290B44
MKVIVLLRGGWLKLANLSMQQKLILLFVFLISVPITYVSYLSSRSTMEVIRQNAVNSAIQVTKDQTAVLDNYIADLKRYTTLPLYHANVQQHLANPETSWEKSNDLHMFLSFLNHSKEEISAVYLVDRAGAIFYDNKPGIHTLYPEKRLKIWQQLSQHNGVNPVVTGKSEIVMNGSDPKHRQVFSVLRTIQSASALQNIGIIVIDVNLSLLEHVITALEGTTQGHALIVDQHGQPIYGDKLASYEAYQYKRSVITTRRSPLSRQLGIQGNVGNVENVEDNTSGHFEFVDTQGIEQLAVYDTSVQTGWTSIVTIPLSQLMAPMKSNRNTLMLTTLIIISFALGIATLLTFALTSPLKALVKLMRQVQHGNLNVFLTPKYNDEIGIIASHFNIMLIRIKELIQEVALTEERKRRADLHALQNQINPHFIYNTLESIRMLAEGSDEPRIAKMTYLLGSQMRYGIVHSDELVTIQQELEHIQNYVDLLTIRFPHKFSLELHIPDELLQLPMIKLVFQPIVENAVFHGFNDKAHGGLITISGYKEDHTVQFKITDNGCGMNPDTLNALRHSLQHTFHHAIQNTLHHANHHAVHPPLQSQPVSSSSHFSMGLRNVSERLILHYGHTSTLQIDSELNRGTTVTITIQD